MDQQLFSPLPRSSPLHPTAAISGGPRSSELLQPTLLSSCTGLAEPDLGVENSAVSDITTNIAPRKRDQYVMSQTPAGLFPSPEVLVLMRNHSLVAVTHENVQPLQHTHLENRTTREFHTHDVYHRVLPILDTEILPPRHFIDDGLNTREVPAGDVWKYTITGRPGRQPSKELGRQPHGELGHSESECSKLQGSKQEAILADKQTLITDEGCPRTEYLWLHPPVFEDPCGRTRSVLIPGESPSEREGLLMKEHHQPEQASVSP